MLNFDDWVYNKPYSGERSFLTVVLLVCVVPYVATVLYFTSRFYREHQLLKYGHAAPAEIIGDTEKRDGGGASLSITYRFTDSHGRIVEGLRKDPPYPLLESIRAKSTVIYDPQNSSKNLLYPPDYAACAPPKA